MSLVLFLHFEDLVKSLGPDNFANKVDAVRTWLVVVVGIILFLVVVQGMVARRVLLLIFVFWGDGLFQKHAPHSVHVARAFQQGLLQQIGQGGRESNNHVTIGLQTHGGKGIERPGRDKGRGHVVLSNVGGVIGVQNANDVRKFARPTEHVNLVVVVLIVDRLRLVDRCGLWLFCGRRLVVVTVRCCCGVIGICHSRFGCSCCSFQSNCRRSRSSRSIR
mmetsp:Transcript_25800/g.59295  ORF Transcript_25800/g.59295 Transcript_25800/m.59295 type:complete len:219 (-) Transcript_25800:522-1178(-)